MSSRQVTTETSTRISRQIGVSRYLPGKDKGEYKVFAASRADQDVAGISQPRGRVANR
jgi:hypothetical protein